MRKRHEFQLGDLTVSYQIAKWHENDGSYHDPFPENIKVTDLDSGQQIEITLQSVPDLWDVIVEKCRDNIDEHMK